MSKTRIILSADIGMSDTSTNNRMDFEGTIFLAEPEQHIALGEVTMSIHCWFGDIESSFEKNGITRDIGSLILNDSGRFNIELIEDKLGCDVQENILVIESLFIYQPFRNKGYGSTAISILAEKFAAQCSMIAVKSRFTTLSKLPTKEQQERVDNFFVKNQFKELGKSLGCTYFVKIL